MPVVLILASGLLTGGSRVPLGVVVEVSSHQLRSSPQVQIVSLLNHLGSVKVRAEPSQRALKDDILRGRVVAGLVVPADLSDLTSPTVKPVRTASKAGLQRASPSAGETLTFIGESTQPPVLQAYSAVVTALNLLGADATAASASKTPLIRLSALTNLSLRSLQRPSSFSPFSYVAPADLVMFTGITAMVLSAGLVELRRQRILRRIMATPITRQEVVVGQLIGTGFIVALQSAGLIALGDTLFKVRWGDPLALILIVSALALAFSGASTLLGTIARTNEQAVAVGAVVAIAFGMLGGCLWPLSVVSPSMATIGHLTPQAWAMDGFIRLIYANSGIVGVLPDIVALLAFASVLCALAQWRLRRAIDNA